MTRISLRRGPNSDSKIKLEPTRDSFAVLFRNRMSGSRSTKSLLRLPFVLGRNLQTRHTPCPAGLALFRVAEDEGSRGMPGMGDDPTTMLRDSAMSFIRAHIGNSDSQIGACYHTYKRANRDDIREEELIPSGAIYLEFSRRIPEAQHHELFEHYKLVVDRGIRYWPGAYVVSVTQETGCNPLRLAEMLLELRFVSGGRKYFVFDYADPTFHRQRALPAIPRNPIFKYQWHLRNAGLGGGDARVDIRAPEAWDITKGSADAPVAVIDDAFDLSTPSFDPDRIVAPLNVHTGSKNVAPEMGEWHGTSVLGLIVGSHKVYGSCGVAPDCPAVPIKLDPLVDDDAEAQAFDYAVEQGAAVISCSWGPYDNYSADLWPLPRVTELALQNAHRHRVAVVFAAGNGSENLAADGYASHPCVIAVAATTDRDERAPYSDYGERVWVSAPSSGGASDIVTTDAREGGYNPFGDLTPEFGGTSAAAPIVAGVIALMQSAFLAANPGKERLSVEEVRAILRTNSKQMDIKKGKRRFQDYWNHQFQEAAPRRPDRHSVAFGYGRIDAYACVRAAARWKRNATTKQKLAKLQQSAPKIRREPSICGRRLGRSRMRIKFPSHRVGDPLSLFHAARERDMSPTSKSRFNSGEHVWLGTQGFREGCATAGQPFEATIARGEGSDGERFSYGEIVALSGDFYERPDDLFYEKPAFYSWLWEENDVSDLKGYFDKELDAINELLKGKDVDYPEYTKQYWWNAKNYAELAKTNYSHFGWHNMKMYCEAHDWALDLALQAGVATGREREILWRKSLFYNGFADHFLTDGFAAGHIRVPRKQIIEWGQANDFDLKRAGFLSKLIHDQDGHRKTDHADGETRPEKDGLHVRNALGTEWWTRCDGQLCILTDETSLRLRQPIEAVKASVKELFGARDRHRRPAGVFTATRHVPFPHPDEVALTDKFNPNAKDRIEKWVDSSRWYEFGVDVKNVTKLFAHLPDIMKSFRAAVQNDVATHKNDKTKEPDKKKNAWIARLPAGYVAAYSALK